ncbi:MAG: DUF2845 domain-containing protein [Spongiibacteraceae bacterium]|nr:DUF2845 domain-containing protein [Spongiibacteraceae bacterium]MBN4055608.1 DUF2845 domain-containing protein [bacterium AH-315-K03]
MGKALPLAILGLFFLSEPSLGSNDSLRCGTRLIQKNTLAVQVRERCGKPLTQEIIGYTLQKRRYANNVLQREFKIEQWLYGPTRGYYNEIIFEGGRVTRINRIKR